MIAEWIPDWLARRYAAMYIVKKEFDNLVWERRRDTRLGVTRTIEVVVPTTCVEDIIASKVEHEGIQRDERIDVISWLNK
jgi:hypothetical protein